MISGLRYTVQTTGIISIYRGLTPTLIGSIPKAGIRFGLNSVIKDLLRDPKTNHLTPINNFFAGMGAGIAEAIIIVAPVETVKTKCIELNQPFVSGLQHIYQTEGVAGIYQGSFATALKQGSNQGLRFMWFNEYKRYVTTYYNVSGDGSSAPKMTPLQSLLGGMSAGCFSTLGNNPFDVVKTRMYVTEVLSLSHFYNLASVLTLFHLYFNRQGTRASLYSSTFDCFSQIIQKEGISALYAGVVPRLGRVVPGQGIIFMSFESIESTLQRNFKCFQ